MCESLPFLLLIKRGAEVRYYAKVRPSRSWMGGGTRRFRGFAWGKERRELTVPRIIAFDIPKSCYSFFLGMMRSSLVGLTLCLSLSEGFV